MTSEELLSVAVLMLVLARARIYVSTVFLECSLNIS